MLREYSFQIYFKSMLICFIFILILFPGCGQKNPVDQTEEKGSTTQPGKTTSGNKNSENLNLGRSAFPWLEKGKLVDGKAIATSKSGMQKISSEFNRQYAEGLKKMEDEDLGKAQEIFEEIIKKYPGSEEASMAEYRIAQIHFRRKSNTAALEAYKKIVQDYPTSPIAENARAAIVYLQTFETHEKAYISPDAEDRKRRGW